MDVNPETLELLENRLAQKVEVQVRDRLFKFYRAIWGVAIVALGFFGYNVISNLNATAKGYAESAVKPSVDRANQAASEASTKIVTMTAQLEAMEDFQQRRLAALLAAEESANTAQAKVEKIRSDTDRQLAEAAAQLETVAQRTRTAGAGGDVEKLATSFAALAKQVELLDQAVRGLQQAAPGDGTPAPALVADPARYTDLISSVEQLTAAPAGSGRVFFQFAGVNREVAQQISAALAGEGYEMPGEERTEKAAGLHEVRYFFPGDAERADRLAEDVNRVLGRAGYRMGVTARGLTGYGGAKPRQGTLELWLEPVPAG
ncbi:MAG TPA: hypothetical protein VM422_01365 [Amaricoccus sp.]|nr:hypothetical protein [Amaricoccus sp.]